MVRLSRRTEHIQTHPANGNAQDSGGMPVHRQTIPETPGVCAGSPLPLPDADGHSYRDILYVGSTCVKWIPPLLIFVTPLLIAVSLTAWAGEFKVIGVHGGDTIRARGGASEIEVRLAGIHALEILSEGIKKGQAYRGMIPSLAYRVSCFGQGNLSDDIDASD
jgi:hypothetical protein